MSINDKATQLSDFMWKNTLRGRSQTCRWRRERDSNPRYGFPHTHFPGVRLQPLGHPSAFSLKDWTDVPFPARPGLSKSSRRRRQRESAHYSVPRGERNPVNAACIWAPPALDCALHLMRRRTRNFGAPRPPDQTRSGYAAQKGASTCPWTADFGPSSCPFALFCIKDPAMS